MIERPIMTNKLSICFSSALMQFYINKYIVIRVSMREYRDF